MGNLDKVALCQIEIWQQLVWSPFNIAPLLESRWVSLVLSRIYYGQTILSPIFYLDLVILESFIHLFVLVWLALLLVDDSMLHVHVVLFVQRKPHLSPPSLKPNLLSASPKSWVFFIYGYSSFSSSLRFCYFHFVLNDEGCYNAFLSMGLFLSTITHYIESVSRDTLSTWELPFLIRKFPDCR